MLLPPLRDVPLPKIPPLHEMRVAVERDVRGLWAGVEALRLHELPAGNQATLARETEPAAEKPWRPPLGWISLAVAGALLATLGFAQILVQRRLSPTVQADTQKSRPSTRKQKKLRRTRPDRTDYSRGT
jgi:hypothetical protein